MSGPDQSLPSRETAAAAPSAGRAAPDTHPSRHPRHAEETEVGSVSTDATGRIVSWNAAAEQLLGFTAPSVRGKRLHDVLQSRDFFGNRITCECGVREMLRRGEHVWRQVIGVTKASGEGTRVVLFVRSGSNTGSADLLYEIRLDARRQVGDRRAADRSRRFPAGIGTLTPSEMKVLRLLASGKRAQHVAGQLNVSLTTVRHHIQNVLRKLDVHTQVEAISMVLQSGVL